MNKTKKLKVLIILFLITAVIAAAIIAREFSSFRQNQFNRRPICKNCNVILITLDILGSKNLPCYGYSRNTAPNLCVFAEDNIYFTKSYSNSALTLPSTFSIFTSLYPHTHGMNVLYEERNLNRKNKTLTEVLQSYGYKTYYFGHLNNPHLPLSRGLERGFENISGKVSTEQNVEDKKWKKSVDDLLNTAKKQNPAFLYLYLSYTGRPYLVGDKKKFLFTERKFKEIPVTGEELNAFTPGLKSYILNSLLNRINTSKTKESRSVNLRKYNSLKNESDLVAAEKIVQHFSDDEKASYYTEYNFLNKIDAGNREQMKYLRALYDEKIVDLDTRLGEFFKAFKKKNLDKNTIVIITSQHGDEFGVNGYYGHGDTLYNPAISVPLIFSVPGIKKQKIPELAQNIDVYPTLLSLLDIKPKTKIEGKDLSRLILNKTKPIKNEFVISEAIPQNVYSVLGEQWKVIVNNSNLELYDLKNDPDEQNNLSASNPEIAGSMLKNIEQMLQKGKKTDVYNFPDWMDDTKKEKIIREGYF